ncbi:hypothetical protein [Mycolicibacterium sp. XJ1819]
MEKRHHRLAYTGIVAAIVLGIGLFALNFPVFLDDYDQWGFQINCGKGYSAELTQAAATVGETDYVDECESALLLRRLWTIPMVVLGGMVLLAVAVAAATTSARESPVSRRDSA